MGFCLLPVGEGRQRPHGNAHWWMEWFAFFVMQKMQEKEGVDYFGSKKFYP
jgi:hypothetical protein